MAGNKEAMRRATLMKLLQTSAQTLPLYVSKSPDEEIPPLCGRKPADPDYKAQVK